MALRWRSELGDSCRVGITLKAKFAAKPGSNTTKSLKRQEPPPNHPVVQITRRIIMGSIFNGFSLAGASVNVGSIRNNAFCDPTKQLVKKKIVFFPTHSSLISSIVDNRGHVAQFIISAPKCHAGMMPQPLNGLSRLCSNVFHPLGVISRVGMTGK